MRLDSGQCDEMENFTKQKFRFTCPCKLCIYKTRLVSTSKVEKNLVHLSSLYEVADFCHSVWTF